MFYTKYIQAICIFVGFAQYCVASTNENLDEPVGYFEKKYMTATFKRIEELGKEDFLDVKAEIRIRDNFNRVRKQVKRLNKELEEIKSIPASLNQTIIKFQKCAHENSEYYTDVEDKVTQTKFFLEHCYYPFKQEFLDFAQTYAQFKSYKLPEPENININLGEKIGIFESIRMPTALEKIKELEKEGVLNVNATIRMRDNFNRASKQIYDLKFLINENLRTLFNQSDFYNCISSKVQNVKEPFFKYETILPCIAKHDKVTESMLQKEN